MANGRERRPGADIGFGVTTKAPSGGGLGGGPAAPAVDAGMALLLRRISGWIPPDDSASFYCQAEQDTAVVTDIDFAGSSAQFRVPASHRGIIQFFQGMSTVVDATFAGSSFGILLDSVPVPGYEAIPIFQAGGAQGNVPGDTWIKLRENQLVSVRFHHAQAIARHVGFQLRGFYWPEGSETGQSG